MNEATRRIWPVAIGIGITAVLLMLLAVLAQKRRAEEATVPSLSISTPTTDAVVDSPLTLRFHSSYPISLGPSGWGAGPLHLHAWVNDVQHMPAAEDIQNMGDSTYTWLLRDTPRGEVTARLGWADAMHRPLSAGMSQTVYFHLR